MELDYKVSLIFESAPDEQTLAAVREHFDHFIRKLQDDDLPTQLFDADYALDDERF